MLWLFCFSLWDLKKWYQRTFLDRHCGQIFFIFADLFLEMKIFGEEKRGMRNYRKFWYIYLQNFHKKVIYLISSQKNTQFEKKNHSKRSLGSQDIEVLKFAIFRVSSTDDGAIFFYLCSSWRPNFPKQITNLSSSHNFIQFQKTKSAEMESGK
jgi:hypothetical protein